jgi:8-amino-7-oxononanoate synthase
MPSLDAYLSTQLDELRAQDRFRDPADARAREQVRFKAAAAGLPFFDASTNDYLGLAADSASVSRETVRLGAGAARLVQGTWPEHEQLEEALARWVGMPSALLFTSGYAANLGAVAALIDRDSVVLSDELNHASIIDGCRLSRGRTVVFPHLDLAALEAALEQASGAATRWVVTESFFSMDGDGPDLRALRSLCDRHGAFLFVDEAHALGLYGPSGAGRCAEVGVRPDALVGTLGKSVGSQGAFVAGGEKLRAFLWNRARSFVFSTGSSPALCARTLLHVEAARAADEARAAVLAHAQLFRTRLQEHGVPIVPGSFGPIVGVLAGPSSRAMALAAALREQGVLAQAIRAPTVPEGRARVRLTVTAAATRTEIEQLSERVITCWRSACRG